MILDLSYPRPTLRRFSFVSLDGEWDFLLEQSDIGERFQRYERFPEDCLKINVPYCYQSKESGINIQTRFDTVWYHKKVSFDYNSSQRVILHVGAADYLAYIYINSNLVYKHKGGYTAFEVDITDYLIDKKADITIRCDDSYDLHQPRGKQKWKSENFGCWYQEVTGIWKSVWYEVVESTYITDVRLTPNKYGYVEIFLSLNHKVNDQKLDVYTYFNDNEISHNNIKISEKTHSFRIKLKEIHFWDLEHPDLYRIILKLSSGDVVQTYFGYRFITTKNGHTYLNDKELFMRLTLEQGYYSKGIYTPKSINEFVKEIELIKECGFNGLRMHQKVEDDRFYALCDYYGLIVWSEMPSCYDFDEQTRENSVREWKEILKEHYNHPSILVWTPCNESWGVPGIKFDKTQQAFLDELYYITKSFDPIRLVVSNDGWTHCKTDIITLHNYMQNPEEFKECFIDILEDIVKNNLQVDYHFSRPVFADGYHYEGQPVMLDEFCGIGLNVNDTSKGWGYGQVSSDLEEFYERYSALVKLASTCSFLSGWCMTQFTDVYQEINGLLTMDRVKKCDFDRINEINNTPRK